MESNKLIPLIISLIIGIILTGAILVPFIQDVTDHKVIYENTGQKMFCVSTDEGTAPVSLSFDGQNLIVDNNYNIRLVSTYTYVIGTDSFYIRTDSSGTYMKFIDVNTSQTITSFDLVAQDGTISGTLNGDSFSKEYARLYYPSAEGDYIMTLSNTAKYVSGSAQIYNVGMSNIGGNKTCIISGSIDEGFTLSIPSTGDVYTDYSVDSSLVDGYSDLYTFTTITFHINGSDISWNRIIIPVESVVIKNDSIGYDNLFNAIPAIIIIAMVGLAATIVRTREA